MELRGNALILGTLLLKLGAAAPAAEPAFAHGCWQDPCCELCNHCRGLGYLQLAAAAVFRARSRKWLYVFPPSSNSTEMLLFDRM